MNIGKSITVGCALMDTNKNELAKAIGVTGNTIYRYSRGEIDLQVSKLALIAEFFGVPVSTLIEWGEK